MNVPKSLRDESQRFILGSIVRMLRQVRSKRWTKKWLVQVYARSYLIYRETLGEYFSYLEKELRADREYELTTELVPQSFPNGSIHCFSLRKTKLRCDFTPQPQNPGRQQDSHR
jgi:hypothetical protein